MTVPDGSRPGLRPVWQRAALLIAGFVALLYAIEAVDAAAPAELDSAGIEPRSADGLWGVVFAPVLHADWAHLSANTIPLLVLGFLVLVSGIGRGLAATAIIWIVGDSVPGSPPVPASCTSVRRSSSSAGSPT